MATLKLSGKELELPQKEEDMYSNKYIAIYLVPVAILAAVIAWYRNAESFILIRILYVLLAYVLNIFYLMYIAYKAMRG